MLNFIKLMHVHELSFNIHLGFPGYPVENFD